MRKVIFLLVLLALSTTIVSAQQFDLVLEGGRVMDPETGLDAVRNVGIRDGKIVQTRWPATVERSRLLTGASTLISRNARSISSVRISLSTGLSIPARSGDICG